MGDGRVNLQQKPDWFRIRPDLKSKYAKTNKIVRDNRLVTVCEESRCPNISQCWGAGTATFMIMGDMCTRACRFCHIKTGYPGGTTDPEEPKRLVQAIKETTVLDYVVITSVDRDDLKDQGANHFSRCIKAIHKAFPKMKIECLTPDFSGIDELIEIVAKSPLDVFAHNIETVEALQQPVRDKRAGYKQSLHVLKTAKDFNPKLFTKSAIMLGFGETKQQVIQAMKDLRAIDVDCLTIGQYLRPSKRQIELNRYVHPDEFNFYQEAGKDLGFKYVISGPFVRSSYLAGELYFKHLQPA